jgi:hypothetical protein
MIEACGALKYFSAELRDLAAAVKGAGDDLYMVDGSDDVTCFLDSQDHITHASPLGSGELSGTETWLFWNDSGYFTVSVVMLCEKESDGETCCIYYEHPGSCEWEIADPVGEAIRAEVEETGATFLDIMRRLGPVLGEGPSEGD